jgi:hypothetical protein
VIANRTVLLGCLLLALPMLAAAEEERFSVISGGKNVGSLSADTRGDETRIDFDYKDNGRGPTMKETIRVDAAGLPVAWTIGGTTTFGSKVAEYFSR